MKDLKDYPISSIQDGWVLGTGELYLFIKRDDGVTETVTIPRPRNSRKTGK